MIEIPDRIVTLLQNNVVEHCSVVVAFQADKRGEPAEAPFKRLVWTKRGEDRLQLAAGWVPAPREAKRKDDFLVFRVDAQLVNTPAGRLICYPADLANCKPQEWLYGRSWEEQVGEVRQFKITRDGKSTQVSYCASRWSGRRVILHNGLQAGETMFSHPGEFGVWHGNRSKTDELGIELVGEIEEPEGDELHVLVDGELIHVADILGFSEWNPDQPPNQGDVEARFNETHLRESAGLMKMLGPLIGTQLTLEQAQARDELAVQRITALAEARNKLSAYSATKELHTPSPTGKTVRRDWRKVLAELSQSEAAAAGKRSVRTSGKPKATKTPHAGKPGSDIPVAEVLKQVRDSLFRQGYEKFIKPLEDAGYHSAADLAQAEAGDLQKILKNQGRRDATIAKAQELVKSQIEAAAASGKEIATERQV